MLSRWTESEEKFLIDSRSRMTADQIAAHLNRSTIAVRRKIQNMGLPPLNQHDRHSVALIIASRRNQRGENNPNWRNGGNDETKAAAKRALKNPERRDARRELHKHLKRGAIQKQPCSVCGSSHSEAHHPDYSMPTYVIWLCKKHHVDQHKCV